MDRPIVTVDGKPAHKTFFGRVTQSMIEKHGSYAAARQALEQEKQESRRLPVPPPPDISKSEP